MTSTNTPRRSTKRLCSACPSLYFHHKTLAIRLDLGGSIDACLASDPFFESLYATLASWGLHRMGPGNTKLVDLPNMIHSFRRMTDTFRKLEELRIEAMSFGA